MNLTSGMHNLIIETVGIEEEAAEGLKVTLGMEIVEVGEINCEREEGGEGTQREPGDLEFLIQDADPSGTTLIDAWNGFNKLSRLAMLWTVHHWCPAGVRFEFNCYRYWAQLLLHQLGGAASHNTEPRGGNSVIPPLDGIVQDHPSTPGRGAKSGRFGVIISVICG